VGAGIFAFLCAILGIQRKTIKKQKEKIKTAQEEVKASRQAAETAVKKTEQVIAVVKQAGETEAKLASQQKETENNIKEAADEETTIDIANSLIDTWNKL